MSLVSVDGVDVFYRVGGEAGCPPALLMHSAGSTHAMWRTVNEALEGRFFLLAPDLYAHGQTPSWGGAGRYTLDAPSRLVEAVASVVAPGPVSLVGHSYSGAICLRVAQRAKIAIDRLVLIEPTLFSLLRVSERTAEIWKSFVADVRPMFDAAEAGAYDHAAEFFLEHLLGPGSWERLSLRRRAQLTALMKDELIAACRAQMECDMTSGDLAGIDVPTLVLFGTDSAKSVVAVSRVLGELLPDVRVEEVSGAGHMLPVTHAQQVGVAILEHLGSAA